jgi:hypothetical protein
MCVPTYLPTYRLSIDYLASIICVNTNMTTYRNIRACVIYILKSSQLNPIHTVQYLPNRCDGLYTAPKAWVLEYADRAKQSLLANEASVVRSASTYYYIRSLVGLS